MLDLRRQRSKIPGVGPPQIQHAVFNDLESAKALINDQTCAVIVEPVQGAALHRKSGGRCAGRKADAGRVKTRRWPAPRPLHPAPGVTPDVLTTAKALGGGFPIGALLATEACASVMTVGKPPPSALAVVSTSGVTP
jgi:succinylornithine aminotransferase